MSHYPQYVVLQTIWIDGVRFKADERISLSRERAEDLLARGVIREAK